MFIHSECKQKEEFDVNLNLSNKDLTDWLIDCRESKYKR